MRLLIAISLPLLFTIPVLAQDVPENADITAESACDDTGDIETAGLPVAEPVAAPATAPERYAALRDKHRLEGNACYYSAFFHGRKTANGEIFRNDRFSAAHLTLPLGTLVEVESRATGKKLRLRVNDRGPYTGPFIIDLSRAAARELGVDVAADRRVTVSVLALPGDEWYEAESKVGSDSAGAVTSAK